MVLSQYYPPLLFYGLQHSDRHYDTKTKEAIKISGEKAGYLLILGRLMRVHDGHYSEFTCAIASPSTFFKPLTNECRVNVSDGDPAHFRDACI